MMVRLEAISFPKTIARRIPTVRHQVFGISFGKLDADFLLILFGVQVLKSYPVVYPTYPISPNNHNYLIHCKYAFYLCNRYTRMLFIGVLAFSNHCFQNTWRTTNSRPVRFRDG